MSLSVGYMQVLIWTKLFVYHNQKAENEKIRHPDMVLASKPQKGEPAAEGGTELNRTLKCMIAQWAQRLENNSSDQQCNCNQSSPRILLGQNVL